MKSNCLISSNSNATNVDCRLVSRFFDPFMCVKLSSVTILTFLFISKGFECNLKIHTNVNHADGLHGSDSFNDTASNQMKMESETSETIAQQIEVWIEEQKDEMGKWECGVRV